MFSTKRLAALGCAALLASGAVHAQTRAPAAHAQPASVQVPAADINRGVPATAAPAPVVAASQPPANPATAAPAQPRLSIEDIDQITRSKIARQLTGDGGSQSGAIALNAPAPAIAPNPVPVVKVVAPRQRAEAVRFVGAFSDMSGPSVLYEFRGAFYPAHVGTKLLNGWIVKRVEGFVVTVAEGRQTWTETISGGTSSASDNQQSATPIARALNDLGGPLPPSIPLSAIGH
jgi:hypothetical protein